MLQYSIRVFRIRFCLFGETAIFIPASALVFGLIFSWRPAQHRRSLWIVFIVYDRHVNWGVVDCRSLNREVTSNIFSVFILYTSIICNRFDTDLHVLKRLRQGNKTISGSPVVVGRPHKGLVLHLEFHMCGVANLLYAGIIRVNVYTSTGHILRIIGWKIPRSVSLISNRRCCSQRKSNSGDNAQHSQR